MASSMRIKFISKGFEEILCSPGTDQVCREQAVRIQSTANSRNRFGGDGFEIHGETANLFGSKRVEWWVKGADRKANMAEAEDKALTGAI